MKHAREMRVAAVGLIALACVAGSMASAYGQSVVPTRMNYQGTLVDETGILWATGDQYLAFSIYDADENGNLKWGPQRFDALGGTGHYAAVPIVNGNFNVILDLDTDGDRLSDAFSAPTGVPAYPRYLQIDILDDPAGADTITPIMPRQVLLSTPYALKAGEADSVGGAVYVTTDGKVGVGTTTPDTALDVEDDAPVLVLNDVSAAGTGRAVLEFQKEAAKMGLVGFDSDVNNDFKIGLELGGNILLDTSGNVGIGLTTPNQKLHVGGNIRLGSNNSDIFGIESDGHMAVQSDGRLLLVADSNNATVGVTGEYLMFGFGSASTAADATNEARYPAIRPRNEAMRIESDGDVLLKQGSITGLTMRKPIDIRRYTIPASPSYTYNTGYLTSQWTATLTSYSRFSAYRVSSGHPAGFGAYATMVGTEHDGARIRDYGGKWYIDTWGQTIAFSTVDVLFISTHLATQNLAEF